MRLKLNATAKILRRASTLDSSSHQLFNKTSTTEILWPRYSPQWFREDNDARNGSREKKPRKARTNMGEIHYRYVWYDGSSKQSGGGQASISQRLLGSDVLTRICSEMKKFRDREARTNCSCLL